MTYRSRDLRHDCSRHGCMIDRAPDWEWMRGVFPRGIMPTDADGIVEINGEILILEEKEARGTLDNGQRHAFVKLSMFRGQTVLCMRLVPENPEMRDVLLFEGKRVEGWQRWTLSRLRAYFAEWCLSAESKLL